MAIDMNATCRNCDARNNICKKITLETDVCKEYKFPQQLQRQVLDKEIVKFLDDISKNIREDDGPEVELEQAEE